MESHLVRIINRLELMTTDSSNLKRNFERDGVVVRIKEKKSLSKTLKSG